MLKTLTDYRITWALSPTAPQVPDVIPRSPLCPWCCGIPHEEVHDNREVNDESEHSSSLRPSSSNLTKNFDADGTQRDIDMTPEKEIELEEEFEESGGKGGLFEGVQIPRAQLNSKLRGRGKNPTLGGSRNFMCIFEAELIQLTNLIQLQSGII